MLFAVHLYVMLIGYPAQACCKVGASSAYALFIPLHHHAGIRACVTASNRLVQEMAKWKKWRYNDPSSDRSRRERSGHVASVLTMEREARRCATGNA